MQAQSTPGRLTLRELGPGAFAAVMATGIVSQAMLSDGATTLSGFLLGAGLAGYLALVAAQSWRLAREREVVVAQARDPRTAFGLFAFAAASNVLASRLAVDGHLVAAWLLLGVGGVSWLPSSYGVPWLVAGRPGVLDRADGTWFLAAVGAQSVAVAITALPPPVPSWLVVVAIGCWSVGIVAYLVVALLVAACLLRRPRLPS